MTGVQTCALPIWIEEALRKAEERYRSIFENAGEGIFQTTPDGAYLSANPALARIYGFDSVEELIRKRRDIEHELYVDPNRRQDFAHLQLACLRSVGLAGRYVSGYLETRPPAGSPRLVGADASHAWCSVRTATGSWLDLDPTNDVVPHLNHVRVAHGRDFGDVTPLRGVIRGGGQHTLVVRVTTRQLSPASGTLTDQSSSDRDGDGVTGGDLGTANVGGVSR